MNYRFTTHSKRLLADLHTPVSIYLKLRDLYPQSVLMESSDYHGNDDSLSFIALKPLASIAINRVGCTASFPDGSKQIKPLESVDHCLQRFLSAFSIEGEEKAQVGLFGYTAYNAVRYLDQIEVADNEAEHNDAPDVWYSLYKYIIVFNHFTNALTLIELLTEDEVPGLSQIESLILNRNFASYGFQKQGEESSTCTDEEFKQQVQTGIELCKKGELDQIVLSRRFQQGFSGDDFAVYRALRSINPSPYLFYFDFGGFRLLGSSPETHCRIQDLRISIDPIAGTSLRTGNAQVDQERTQQLLQDPKEHAEHAMLVDLASYDLRKNARNIKLDFYKQVQYYSHVIHLVSRVSGQLPAQEVCLKAFCDTFPAGTLSGAPKVKALEYINSIEKHDRGIYGGCIGFVGFDGSLNQAIVIRTFVSRNKVLYYQAGAGIVAQSLAENEEKEVRNKLAALTKAIYLAETIGA